MDEPITSPLPRLQTDPESEQAETPVVKFKPGVTFSVEAKGNLQMSKAGAFSIRAGSDLELTNGGAGAIVSGRDLKVQNGGAITFVSGRDFELENGGGQIMVVGGNMAVTNGRVTLAVPGGELTVNKGFVGVALTKDIHLNDDSRVLLDTPRALLFGAAVGSAFALVRWLLKR